MTAAVPPLPSTKAPPDKAAPGPNVVAALFWMAMALCAFVLVAISGRAAGKGIDTMHLMFYRSIIGLLLITMLAWFSPAGLRQLATARLWHHGLRNTIHFVAQYSWLSALLLIPLTELIAIEFTAPLWVALLAPLVLKERLTLSRVVAATLGFIGVLVIIRPGTVPISDGTMFAVVAALGFAGSMIVTKQLVRTETILCFLFHMSWMQLVMAWLPLIDRLEVPSAEVVPWIIAIALAGMMAHFSLARAFTHADAMIVAPMDFMRLPLLMGVGVVLYGEAVDPMVLLGAVVVIAANLINIVRERRR